MEPIVVFKLNQSVGTYELSGKSIWTVLFPLPTGWFVL